VAITLFGMAAFLLHADSPTSCLCLFHIVPLPLFGWFIEDLPAGMDDGVALGQLLLGCLLWALLLRAIRLAVHRARTAPPNS
jgi:hypothetical protein